jgi:hypothetical protein
MKKGRIGHCMRQALNFALERPGWHNYTKDRATSDIIKRLEKLQLVKINKFGQFKAIT